VSSETPIHLSVVIPAYREETRLRKSLPLLRRYLESQPYAWEVLVVDDGSPDQTSQVARGLLEGTRHEVLRNEPNAGKGASIRRGMLAARGAHALFSDADFSTPIEDLERLWPAIQQGVDVAFGSRVMPGSELIVRQPWYREVMGRSFNLLVRLMILPGVGDTQCGFKLFSRRAVDLIFPHQSLDGFAFDVELLALARAAGLRIQEVAVRWVDSPGSRVSLRRGAGAFLDLARLRGRLRRLRREGALAAAPAVKDTVP
jgi:dolichyl-phosphate beta-glucosyltransferase